jgi:purine-binding chemotaxis protein CheW
MQAVVFRIARERYALPTSTAREVIAYEQPRRLPGAEAWVEGVLNLRGEIVPICDLMVALGLGSVQQREQIVVCDTASGSVGIIVEEVSSVVALAAGSMSQPETLRHPALAGLVQLAGELVVLLDLDAALGGVGGLDLRELMESAATDVALELEDAA